MKILKLLKKYWWILLIICIFIFGYIGSIENENDPSNHIPACKNAINAVKNATTVDELNCAYNDVDLIYSKVKGYKDNDELKEYISELELLKLLENVNITEMRISEKFDYDGSHKQLTILIKENMHNPDSYQHVKTTYEVQGDTLFVATIFRGTNAFNAVVTNTVLAICSIRRNKVDKWYYE